MFHLFNRLSLLTMHMADALVSPAVAGGAAVAAAALIAVSARKLRSTERDDIVPLMGVMGAFVFAAQMINFSIPGTGSSGHVIGGVLLAAVLGPWAAFLTLCSVLIIQCLIFADGGLLALGCNIINMGAMSCLVAYPLIYRPIAGNSFKPWRLMAAAIAASVVALELGALAVTVQTELSGVTALPTGVFLSFMLPIHLAIGLIEGLATGAVLCFIAKYRPDTLVEYHLSVPDGYNTAAHKGRSLRNLLVIFAIAAAVLGGGLAWLASADPDGLEWSIARVAPMFQPESMALPTALMPDYDSSLAGIIGAVLVMLMLWAVSSMLFRSLRHARLKSGHRDSHR